MVRHLQAGDEYGKDFWHHTKQEIQNWPHGRRSP